MHMPRASFSLVCRTSLYIQKFPFYIWLIKFIWHIARLRINLSLKTVQLSPPKFSFEISLSSKYIFYFFQFVLFCHFSVLKTFPKLFFWYVLEYACGIKQTKASHCFSFVIISFDVHFSIPWLWPDENTILSFKLQEAVDIDIWKVLHCLVSVGQLNY